MPFRRDRAGFTLMEVLVAMVLAAIIAASVFTVFDRTLEVGSEVEGSGRILQMVRMTLDRLAVDLRSLARNEDRKTNGTGDEDAFLFLGASPESALVPDDNGTGLVLMSFPTWSSLDTAQTLGRWRLNRVSYIVRASAGAGSLVRREEPFMDMESCQAPVEVEVADEVTGVRLIFVDREGRETDAWNMDGEGLDPPVLVRFQLTCRADSLGEWTLERSILPGFSVNGPEKGDEN
ncbi:MAG: prepilin-type N-terminal cleavage/methylation domain-containing protein [Deltaproteobacteria bacterium]|nr:prepilin-type N-terminal cleavage/methylation domain-containing protein [Deltaproteobacteria bacterium]